MKKLFLSAIIVFFAGSLFAQDRAKQLDSLFSDLYAEKKFNGNVLIAENGIPLLQKSYGKAFREKGVDLNLETVFELASVSKQFTAMGIMLLKKQGRLTYNDSLRKYFPELPYSNITIRHLLNHVSGLPDYMEMFTTHWDNKKIMTNDSMIALLSKVKPPLLFVPGEKWTYSNTGYALLASIIERASGLSFNGYLQANIFKPLSMRSTRIYRKRFEKTVIDNYAYGYVKGPDGHYVMADSLPATAAMVYALDGIYGDGVVNSTLADLLKWDQALYTEKLIPRAMMQEALTPAPLNNGRTFNYGFGWLLSESKEFGRTMSHSGGWPGYSTYIERHPENKKTIILLANGGSAIGSIKAIRNILYGITEKKPVEIQLEEKVLRTYTGEYLLSGTDTIKVIFENGKLFASGAGQDKHPLYPEEPDLFFRKDKEYKTRFMKDEKGLVIALRIVREGPAIEATKIK